jgi:peptide/nickel transport system ATP-binding protein
MNDILLDIRKLTTCFSSPQGIAKAVDTVSLSFMQGETLAIVGESGCGKTVLALSILGLIPDPPGRITDGEILYRGDDLLDMSETELREVRGNHISMIFQEPMTALNPVFRINDQIAEPLILHQGYTKKEALEKSVDALDLVGIPNPTKIARAYPHELSGGMRQRVMIAMALACTPDILIADEPTTALDVTIQAQILDLMNDLKARMNGSLMLITHDLGVVARMAQRVAVMYSGKIVELSDAKSLYKKPLHPYTQGLLTSVPTLGDRAELTPIPGIVPSIFNLPQGCRFHPRCPHAFDKCKLMLPHLTEPEPGRFVRCWLHGDD